MNKNDLFNRIVGLISKVYNTEAKLNNYKDEDVTKLQLELLKILYFSCDVNVSGLSECLNINLPNCSREVKKMTEMGYVEKNISTSDKRKTDLELTIKGKEKVNFYLKEMNNNFFLENSDWEDEKIAKCIRAIELLEKEVFKY